MTESVEDVCRQILLFCCNVLRQARGSGRCGVSCDCQTQIREANVAFNAAVGAEDVNPETADNIARTGMKIIARHIDLFVCSCCPVDGRHVAPCFMSGHNSDVDESDVAMYADLTAKCVAGMFLTLTGDKEIEVSIASDDYVTPVTSNDFIRLAGCGSRSNPGNKMRHPGARDIAPGCSAVVKDVPKDIPLLVHIHTVLSFLTDSRVYEDCGHMFPDSREEDDDIDLSGITNCDSEWDRDVHNFEFHREAIYKDVIAYLNPTTGDVRFVALLDTTLMERIKTSVSILILRFKYQHIYPAFLEMMKMRKATLLAVAAISGEGTATAAAGGSL